MLGLKIPAMHDHRIARKDKQFFGINRLATHAHTPDVASWSS
jgi:hypothetical protein